MAKLNKIPEIIRKYVRKRDKNRCRLCNKDVQRHGEIHHIYSRRSFIPAYLNLEWIPNNNHPYNLILLCPDCHRKIHNGSLKIEKDKLIEQNKKYPLSDEVKQWIEENKI